jgi:5-(aminomethyl)-3-furanmethanol phosphate kinase
VSDRPAIDLVIKFGRALLGDAPGAARATRELAQLTRPASAGRILVVPGGGALADAVREVDRRYARSQYALTDDAAHWMAILAMDQYAYALASLDPDAVVVEAPEDAVAALHRGRLPVLAPHRWLRRADPLPHCWDVTSDSIAAWVAGAVGARHLLLVKPVPGSVATLSDPYVARALSLAPGPAPDVHTCTADDVVRAATALAALVPVAGL